MNKTIISLLSMLCVISCLDEKKREPICLSKEGNDGYVVNNISFNSINTELSLFIDERNTTSSHNKNPNLNFITYDSICIDSSNIMLPVFNMDLANAYKINYSFKDILSLVNKNSTKGLAKFLEKKVSYDSILKRKTVVDSLFNCFYYLSYSERPTKLDTLKSVNKINIEEYFTKWVSFREKITAFNPKNRDEMELRSINFQRNEIKAWLIEMIESSQEEKINLIYSDSMFFYIVIIERPNKIDHSLNLRTIVL